MNPEQSRVFRVGTRGSALARWQAGHACAALHAAGYRTRTVEIATTGDLAPEMPIRRLADPAVFTRQLDEAMLEGRIDLAVHSLKDLPTRLPPGITLAAISAREDPRDALVSRDGARLLTLRQGARVTTSSPRRCAQLLRLRPDLEIVEVRGNVDTRLARLDNDPATAATILACAGLIRLGLAERISERLSVEAVLPAPGQGALALTVRSDDVAGRLAARAAMHDSTSALCVDAERALLHALACGCEAPVGALGTLRVPAAGDAGAAGSVLQLRGRILSLDGRELVEAELTRQVGGPSDAEALGEALAARLVAAGGGRLLAGLPASDESP